MSQGQGRRMSDEAERASFRAPTGSSDNHSAEYFISNYKMGKTLGVGSFGKVKIAEHIVTGHKVAVKILHRKKIRQMDMEEKVRREIKILKLFMHPHIIRLYDVVDTPSDIYVVSEYVQSGELFDYIVEKGRLEEHEARRYFQQIISGVEYCHRNMVVHRDLKPENLLLDSNYSVKIADFGLSNVMRDGHFLKTSCGSPNYAAPEVISGKLYSGPEVDVWSCGVILYALLCGSLPFDDESIPNLFKKIKGGIYNLPSHLSPGARDLIPRMLLVDPLKRITIPEIRQHPWFNLHLPRYLAVAQVETIANAGQVDPEVVDVVVRLGFTRDYVVQSVKDRLHNKVTVAYYLEMDNRKKVTSNEYLNKELTEAHDPRLQYPQGIMSTVSNSQLSGVPNSENFTRVVAERRWQLGAVSHDNPRLILSKLIDFLAMAGRGGSQIAWKRGGPYNLRCKWTLQPHSNSAKGGLSRNGFSTFSQPQEVKFEIQLFKVRDEEYCVDVQRLSGELFLFMDICGQLLTQV